MNEPNDPNRALHSRRQSLHSRRQFLHSSGMGLGAVALGSLLPQNDDARFGTHHAPKAKRVIFLFMAGAPSQIDLFDYKPQLQKLFRASMHGT